ncbi:MAG TPA: DMT family transporter [Burkholderiaceae bacterium]|nr:DMT family transporter [Burkholderiaceae bacterium]
MSAPVPRPAPLDGALPTPRTSPAAPHGREHRRALGVLMLCTVLWSTAGVGTRLLERVEGFEVAFWRALFCAACVGVVMAVRGGGAVWRPLVASGPAGLVSGLMWGTMFTAFMLALTRTSVANVLVVMAASPLLAALLGWVVLREPVLARTWSAIAIAGAGIVWMVRDGLSADGLEGMAIAFAVPVAAAINIVLLKRTGARVDLLPAVGIGALMCCAVTLPIAWPLSASAHDLTIVALLGVFQLAVPCMLMVRASRHLAPHEIALLGLLEVVLGPLWAWLGAGERPGAATIQGGALVLAALVLNELVGMRAKRA